MNEHEERHDEGREQDVAAEARKAAEKTLDEIRKVSNEAATKARAASEKTMEEIKVASNQLVDRVRALIEEGNVRRIKVMKDQKTLLEVPLTVAAGAGAAVVLITPVLAALGALAALLSDVTLIVEREPGTTASTNGGHDSASDTPGDKTIGNL